MMRGQPIFILKEGSKRETGRDAMKANIDAAKGIAAAVRTSLGPRGMDKMLVDSLGDIVITNDGVTILKEMDVEHPAAKMMVEVSKTQDSMVGDGTTTAVIIAGALLQEAESLINQNVHPTVIAEERAADKYPNTEVLNSYYVGEDGFYKYYEIILVDKNQPTIYKDNRISWISEPQNKGRVYRGLTSAGYKGRGLRTGRQGSAKSRPSIRANDRLRR